MAREKARAKDKEKANARVRATAADHVAAGPTARFPTDPIHHSSPGRFARAVRVLSIKKLSPRPPVKHRVLSALILLATHLSASAADPSDLVRLYEDEILALDLYVALGKIHPDIRPFQNIPRSEAMHRETMAGILKAEGIELPKPPEGKRFVSEGLDETFAKWLAEGVKSEADACRVGVRLEDHDIAELRKAQAGFPKHKETLAALEAASNNHFRAFHRNLKSRGGDYKAEALPAADIQKILDGENDCGACGNVCGKPAPQPTPETSGNGAGRGRRYRGGR